MIGGYSDDDRFAARGRRQFRFNKIAYFAAAFADQADDDNVAINAGQHLPHQHRFANTRPCDNYDALALSDGQ